MGLTQVRCDTIAVSEVVVAQLADTLNGRQSLWPIVSEWGDTRNIVFVESEDENMRAFF